MSPAPPVKANTIWQKLDPFTYVDEWIMPRVNPGNNEIVSWIVYVFFSFIFAFLLYSFFGFILQTASPLVIVVSGSMLPTMARGDVVILHGVTGDALNVPEVVLDGVDLRKNSLSDIADVLPLGSGSWEVIFRSTGDAITIPKKGDSDIVVYVASHKGLEIIHRAVIKVRSGGEYFLITKGDNNPALDQDCGVVTESYYPGTAVPYWTTSKSCPSPRLVSLEDVNGKALLWIPYLGYIKLLLVDSWQGRA